jgi:hypothetical protein
MNDELETNLVGSGREILVLLSQNLSGGTGEYHEKYQDQDSK